MGYYTIKHMAKHICLIVVPTDVIRFNYMSNLFAHFANRSIRMEGSI